MPRDRLIYLDHNATTPLDPRVWEAMVPFFTDAFGNAASRQHAAGREAAAAVERARGQVAALIGADPREIVWTSGATESINLALKGLAASPARGAAPGHVVTVRTEHRAVLDVCEELERRGHAVTRLAVDGAGRIDLDALRAALRPDTFAVAVMHGNNETGLLHPVGDVGRLCHERGVPLFTDATQTFGKESIDVQRDGIDLLAFSAHKCYGPKGVGGLHVRRRAPRIRCAPLLHGGGHERGLRSGTLNVPGIVGLGVAAGLCADSPDGQRVTLAALRDRLQERLSAGIPDLVVNAAGAPRLAGTLNVSIPGVEAEALMARVPGVAMSSASACTSAHVQPSHVLGAMGLDDDLIAGSLRLSPGRFTTPGEIDRAAELLIAAAAAERADPGGAAPACST